MKDFFSKIYNSQYFIIGLFIAIVILAIIFVILVFSGKKNKKVKENPGKNLEENLATINNAVASEGGNGGADVQPVATPVPTPEVPAMNNNIESNQSPVVPDVSVPINNAVNVETEQVSAPVDLGVTTPNVEETAPTPNEDIFNTSIFHGMPEDLAAASQTPVPEVPAVDSTPAVNAEVAPVPENVAIGPKVEEEKEDITQGLFEPAPDLSEVAVNVPVTPEPAVAEVPAPEVAPMTPSFELPTLNKEVEKPAVATPEVPNIPDIALPSQTTKEPELGGYQERIQTPNQFSSVYINKEEPKEEKPVEMPKSDKPPYDPTLFSSVANSVPDIKPVMPEQTNEVNIQPDINTPNIEPSMPSVNVSEIPVNNLPNDNVVSSQPSTSDLPSFDVVPPLDSLNQTSEVSDNSSAMPGGFEMPSLASLNTAATSTSNEMPAGEGGLPNFNNETFNIK